MYEFGMNVARGYVEDFQSIHKFGSNLALSGSAESIWSAGGLYPWSSLATAQTLYFISTDSGDTGTLTVQGLDTNYNSQIKTYTLNGLTAVDSGSDTWLRVFRMSYADENAGTITARVTSGTGTVVAQIDAAKGQTLMAVYTIPAGFNGYLLQYTASVGKGDDVNLDLFIRDPAINGFRIKNELKLYEATFTQQFAIPMMLVEKSDIDFRGVTTNPGSDCIVTFDLILDKR